jgi:hypothetical protein
LNANWGPVPIQPEGTYPAQYEFKIHVKDTEGNAAQETIGVLVLDPKSGDGDRPTPGAPGTGPSPSSTETSLSSQFKTKLTTTTLTTIPKLVISNINCDPIQESIKLGPTTISQKELLVLASMDKCKINQGTVILDIPKTPNLKLLVGDFDKSQIVVVNTTDLQNIPTGTTPSKTPTTSWLKLGKLATPLFGKDLQTGLPKSVSTINGVVLWNAGSTTITTTAAHNAEVVITFTK